MSHFYVWALVEDENDMDALMAPFYDDLQVEPRRQYVSTRPQAWADNASELDRMQEYYKTTDMQQLSAHMPDWRGEQGGIDEQGLYSITTRNPRGEWDYFQLVGEPDAGFGRMMPDDRAVLPICELPNDYQKPYAIVTKTDGWIASETFDQDTCEFVPHPCWDGYVAECLSGHREHLIVALDCHN